ncbi:MAG: NAD-dependent epimerase/dehydratase family protein [bacterium]
MNILITGASGFVGRALCKAPRTLDHKIRTVFRTHPGAKFDFQYVLVNDINADTDWAEALEGINVVVHLAARAHIIGNNDPVSLDKINTTNTAGTLQLANTAANVGVKRFVFISSIGVNGSGTVTPFTEQALANPCEPYAISKLEAEQGLREIAAKTGMEAVIVRAPLIYGPGCPGNFLRLLELVYKGMPLPLGSLKNSRSLIGVQNLVDFLIQCVEHPLAANEMFLIADRPDISTPDLIRTLAQGMGRPSYLMQVPHGLVRGMTKLVGKQATFDKLCGSLQIDSSYSRRLLAWEQPVELKSGLLEVGRWYASCKLNAKS